MMSISTGFFLNRYELPFKSDNTIDVGSVLFGNVTYGGTLSRAFTAGGIRMSLNELHAKPHITHVDTVAEMSSRVSLLGLVAESEFLSSPSSRCDGWWCQRYDRVVILVVDALRFDFLAYNQSYTGDLPYINKLPSVHKLLQQRTPRSVSRHTHAPPQTPSLSDKAYLARFRADAPTVTMQRLKALTTGSLPTFLDIKDNFQSSAIEEDNWPSLVSKAGLHSLCVGDDTWQQLFPHEFSEIYPFPSFNVHDLDTVDEGCRQRLHEVVRRTATATATAEMDVAVEVKVESNTPSPPPTPPLPPPAVVVAHMLGVDHAGHRFGPRHPEMRRKLGEVDDAVGMLAGYTMGNGVGEENNDNLINSNFSPSGSSDGHPARGSISSSSASRMLLVLGDHGMTEGGNHGGNSVEETDAGLLAVSSRSIGVEDRGEVAWGCEEREDDGDRHNKQFTVGVSDGDTDQNKGGDESRCTRLRAAPLEHLPTLLKLAGVKETDMPPVHAHAHSHHHPPSSDHDITPRASTNPSVAPLIWQTDLVPALSLAMGIPIPFGNLGRVPPALIPAPSAPIEHLCSLFPPINTNSSRSPPYSPSESLLHLLVRSARGAHTLLLNTAQVIRYTDAYSAAVRNFPDDVLVHARMQIEARDVAERLRAVEAALTSLASHCAGSGLVNADQVDELVFRVIANNRRLTRDLAAVLDMAKASFQREWTQFDVFALVAALFVLLIVAVASLGRCCSSLMAEDSRVTTAKLQRTPHDIVSINGDSATLRIPRHRSTSLSLCLDRHRAWLSTGAAAFLLSWLFLGHADGGGVHVPGSVAELMQYSVHSSCEAVSAVFGYIGGSEGISEYCPLLPDDPPARLSLGACLWLCFAASAAVAVLIASMRLLSRQCSAFTQTRGRGSHISSLSTATATAPASLSLARPHGLLTPISTSARRLLSLLAPHLPAWPCALAFLAYAHGLFSNNCVELEHVQTQVLAHLVTAAAAHAAVKVSATAISRLRGPSEVNALTERPDEDMRLDKRQGKGKDGDVILEQGRGRHRPLPEAIRRLWLIVRVCAVALVLGPVLLAIEPAVVMSAQGTLQLQQSPQPTDSTPITTSSSPAPPSPPASTYASIPASAPASILLESDPDDAPALPSAGAAGAALAAVAEAAVEGDSHHGRRHAHGHGHGQEQEHGHEDEHKDMDTQGHTEEKGHDGSSSSAPAPVVLAPTDIQSAFRLALPAFSPDIALDGHSITSATPTTASRASKSADSSPGGGGEPGDGMNTTWHAALPLDPRSPGPVHALILAVSSLVLILGARALLLRLHGPARPLHAGPRLPAALLTTIDRSLLVAALATTVARAPVLAAALAAPWVGLGWAAWRWLLNTLTARSVDHIAVDALRDAVVDVASSVCISIAHVATLLHHLSIVNTSLAAPAPPPTLVQLLLSSSTSSTTAATAADLASLLHTHAPRAAFLATLCIAAHAVILLLRPESRSTTPQSPSHRISPLSSSSSAPHPAPALSPPHAATVLFAALLPTAALVSGARAAPALLAFPLLLLCASAMAQAALVLEAVARIAMAQAALVLEAAARMRPLSRMGRHTPGAPAAAGAPPTAAAPIYHSSSPPPHPHPPSASPSLRTHPQAPPSRFTPTLILSSSLLLPILAWLLHFTSGHSYSFADLHVAAAFIGFPNYHPIGSPALLLLNVVHPFVLVVLGAAAAPAVAAEVVAVMLQGSLLGVDVEGGDQKENDEVAISRAIVSTLSAAVTASGHPCGPMASSLSALPSLSASRAHARHEHDDSDSDDEEEEDEVVEEQDLVDMPLLSPSPRQRNAQPRRRRPSNSSLSSSAILSPSPPTSLTSPRLPRLPRVGLHVIWAWSAASAGLTALNVAVQRRHLMVWAIFAPKFVINTVVAGLTLGMVILVSWMGRKNR